MEWCDGGRLLDRPFGSLEDAEYVRALRVHRCACQNLGIIEGEHGASSRLGSEDAESANRETSLL